MNASVRTVLRARIANWSVYVQETSLKHTKSSAIPGHWRMQEIRALRERNLHWSGGKLLLRLRSGLWRKKLLRASHRWINHQEKSTTTLVNAIVGCEEEPCQNSGVCRPYLFNEIEHKFNCSCPNGFHGYTCENKTTMSFSGETHTRLLQRQSVIHQ